MLIRTLGVSLIVVAAIVASLTVARQRSEERHGQPEPSPDRAPATFDPNLDEIRAAGL